MDILRCKKCKGFYKKDKSFWAESPLALLMSKENEYKDCDLCFFCKDNQELVKSIFPCIEHSFRKDWTGYSTCRYCGAVEDVFNYWKEKGKYYGGYICKYKWSLMSLMSLRFIKLKFFIIKILKIIEKIIRNMDIFYENNIKTKKKH